MHNDRMLTRAATTLLAPVLASALVLSGCSGDDSPTPAEGDSSSAAAGPTDYLDVPDGVDLTAQGSELTLGDSATVAYEPRQDEVAALELTVSAIEKASFKLFVGWKLDKATLSTTPYFVRVKVANVGDADLGGRRVPLYAVDGANKLIESSTFASTFKPCPSDSFPDKFGQGDTFKTCLVYLAPDRGELTAASFRPTEEFDPIVWTGEIGKVDTGDSKGDKESDGKGDKSLNDDKQSKGGGKAG